MAPVTTSSLKSEQINLDQIREQIVNGSAFVYAVVDACDEPDVPAKVSEIGNERAISLYRGWAEREHWSIAPYLFVLDLELLDWVIDQFGSKPWGFFAVSNNDSLPEMRKHFRKFLTVEAPDGESLYFRFYDPRVLVTYLETCNDSELSEFFGAAQSLLTYEENEGNELVRYRIR